MSVLRALAAFTLGMAVLIGALLALAVVGVLPATTTWYSPVMGFALCVSGLLAGATMELVQSGSASRSPERWAVACVALGVAGAIDRWNKGLGPVLLWIVFVLLCNLSMWGGGVLVARWRAGRKLA